jgi:hypothetical protein
MTTRGFSLSSLFAVDQSRQLLAGRAIHTGSM